MHDIDAEIAGADLADQRVEIRAVAVEISAGFMEEIGDLDDLAGNLDERIAGLLDELRARRHFLRRIGDQVADLLGRLGRALGADG